MLKYVHNAASRPIADSKSDLHFVNHELILSWLSRFNLSTDFFVKPPTVYLEDAIVMPEEINNELAQKTLEVVNAHLGSIIDLLNSVTSYLGERDANIQSDLLFVLGAPSMARIETAVKLYIDGVAPYLFITGGKPLFKPEADSEAIKYREFALANGVPEDKILVHDGAINLADNVKGGLNRLDELGFNFNSMTTVTSWFNQRRSYAMLMKYVPDNVQVFRVNAPTSPTGGLNEYDWYRNEKGIKIVAGEFFKIRVQKIKVRI